MATPKKVGKRWRMQLQIKGKRVGKYFATKRECINWQIEAEVLASESDKLIQGYTVEEMLRRYASEVTSGEDLRELSVIKAMAKQPLGEMQTIDLCLDDLQGWLKSEGERVKKGTVMRNYATLKKVIKKGQEWRLCHPIELSTLKLPGQGKPRTRIITDMEVEQLIMKMGVDKDNPAISNKRQELGVIFLLALETGMRQSEIVYLEWQNVHLDEFYVHLPMTKNGDKRDVPISEYAVTLLQCTKPKTTGRVFQQSARYTAQQFYRMRKKVGIEDITFHDARHTAVTRLGKLMDFRDLARVVGHRNLNQTLAYYNPTVQDLAAKLR